MPNVIDIEGNKNSAITDRPNSTVYHHEILQKIPIQGYM